ncbi:MAG: hypothetical protein WC700_03770 [Gemmatimonadaceae bacterium]|jgi:hypothetical protein
MKPSPFVVITSIAPPTDAVRAFAERVGDQLIVVGDRKTPPDWSLPPVEYVGISGQESGGRLGTLLPWNHYCRKMLGYLRAAQRGAEAIYDTDDDNTPKPAWGIPLFEGAWQTSAAALGWVNVYRWFTDAHIWPRGFPLRAITDPRAVVSTDQTSVSAARVGVWQAMADGDPDVDAIYRLVDGRACFFRDREPLVLGEGTLCPFNSQATAFQRACFPLLYLPASVSSRVTDILRGLVAQPVLWAAGMRLGFTTATVVQDRNPHDLLRDFEAELPLYLRAEEIVDTVIGAVRGGATLEANLIAAYSALERTGVVDATEPPRVEAWLHDLAAST